MIKKEDIKEANGRIFASLSLLLNTKPDFVTKDMVDTLVKDYRLPESEAFSLLFCAALGFDTSFEKDRAVWESYAPFMLHILDENIFLNDPYYKNITLAGNKNLNGWELKTDVIPPYSAFVCDDPIIMPDGRIIPQIGVFDVEYRFLSVSQNGREWMTMLPNELTTQKIPIAKARRKVLTYGLGLGYFAYMCSLKDDVSSVTVVETDGDVISLFENNILPLFPFPDKIKIIRADAYGYAENTAPYEGYDYIFADIWHDASDGVPAYKKFKSFEHLYKNTVIDYWIENTLKLYM